MNLSNFLSASLHSDKTQCNTEMPNVFLYYYKCCKISSQNLFIRTNPTTEIHCFSYCPIIFSGNWFFDDEAGDYLICGNASFTR